MTNVANLAERVRQSPPRCGDVRVVCIDGPAGSGKTTLAGELSAALGGVPVLHLDDLYEGWGQELGDALAERLDAWLLEPWSRRLPGRHPRYDWFADAWSGDSVVVDPTPIVILEGCGSGSRLVRARAALVIWIEAEPAVRLARGLQRDGEHLDPHWRDWQRKEAQHFAADGTREAADVRLIT